MKAAIEFLSQPWPWYVAGPLIGLTVPVLLLLGNKPFGISSNLRHICAVCFPSDIRFFKYPWKRESWNLLFVGGVLIGGILASTLLQSGEPIIIHQNLQQELSGYGITTIDSLVPESLFSFASLLTLRGIIILVVGGFLVGFGTRYAGGCTSGHSIFGLSNLQLPSLVATICFMIGGIIMANFVLPTILNL